MMYDELTRGDVQKMQEEIDYRTQVLRPKLIEDVQTARAFGDLSENFEYKCAKQEKNRNDSRIRYLQRMIKTARIIDDRSGQDTAGLYDTVEIFMENTGKSRRIKIFRICSVFGNASAIPPHSALWCVHIQRSAKKNTTMPPSVMHAAPNHGVPC